MDVLLDPNQLTTTTYLQRVSLPAGSTITTFSFNREFYCINDHDHETSCNGIIFFGNHTLPVISIPEGELRTYELLMEVFLEECRTRDNIQGEMLRILLKRLIIKTTRLAKKQLLPQDLNDTQVDLVRKYKVLVDLHYRQKRKVSDYAAMLYKSPKTLSNLFASMKLQSPLLIIHERLILEAKRLLMYSDKTAKEIAFDLGFEDAAAFHKLFKKMTGATPQQFKVSTNALEIQ